MEELIHKLGIDWKLLLAQAVNFLILLFLLKKFLYKPVIELLAKRKKDIEESVLSGERIARELADIEARKIAEIDGAKSQADMILRETRLLAKEKEQEFLRAAEQKVEKLVKEARQRIREEQARAMDEVAGEVKELVFMVTEKVLRERLPEKVYDEFVEEAIVAAQKK
ncbi:MAG: F0F1 ATP synthase subunit B [bacterium]|nr:F0F1 ATP synthase subunit B [bacterium]